jgi:hypothetical protein
MSDIVRMTGLWGGVRTMVDGTAIIIEMEGAPIPATTWVVPVAGDTITVSYSLDGGTSYIAWPNGAVTSASAAALKELVFYGGVTHLKFQRTGGAGVTSTCGVS